jgi:hypothetical protein
MEGIEIMNAFASWNAISPLGDVELCLDADDGAVAVPMEALLQAEAAAGGGAALGVEDPLWGQRLVALVRAEAEADSAALLAALPGAGRQCRRQVAARAVAGVVGGGAESAAAFSSGSSRVQLCRVAGHGDQSRVGVVSVGWLASR